MKSVYLYILAVAKLGFWLHHSTERALAVVTPQDYFLRKAANLFLVLDLSVAFGTIYHGIFMGVCRLGALLFAGSLMANLRWSSLGACNSWDLHYGVPKGSMISRYMLCFQIAFTNNYGTPFPTTQILQMLLILPGLHVASANTLCTHKHLAFHRRIRLKLTILQKLITEFISGISFGNLAAAREFQLFRLILAFHWNALMLNHTLISLVISAIFSKHLSY